MSFTEIYMCIIPDAFLMVADQMEKMAENPEMLRQANEHFSKMTPQEREEFQKLQASAGPMPFGGEKVSEEAQGG